MRKSSPRAGRASLKILRSAVALLAAASLVSAQDPVLTLKVNVSLVTLDVGVTDTRGVAVTTLNRNDFVVYEDGEPRELQAFASAGAPYSTLLLFDASGSTLSQRSFLIEAVNGFLRGLGAGDRVSLATFAAGIRTLVAWRPARGQALDVALVPPPGGTGRTDFYAALEWAAQDLRRVDGRKGVIVFTDGLDSSGPSPQQAGFRRAVTAVAQSGTPFYFVGVNMGMTPAPGQRSPRGGASVQEEPRRRMDELARVSGGRLFLPTRIEDVIPLYQEIARELGTVYTLGFAAGNPADDGKYHRIDVRVRNPLLRVSQSRQGHGPPGAQALVNNVPPPTLPRVPPATPIPVAPAAPSAALPVPPAAAPVPATVADPPTARSVLLGPDVAPYSIPRGATLFIGIAGSFANDLENAFQRRSVPLRVVSNRPQADFVLADEAPPGNPPRITITNTKTGLVGFAHTLPGRAGAQGAESVAARLIDKINSGR